VGDDSARGAWFAEDEFWTAYAPLLFDAKRWAEAPAVVDAILALSGLADEPPAGLPVLDLCCGPGRHALELSRRGYPVCGVDITAPYLEAARESAQAEGLSAEFVQADARSFSRPGAFKLALNLYTSFGYFDDPADDQAMLARLYESLAPQGILIMEMVGKETAARDFTEGEWFERDGKLVLTEFSVQGAWEGLKNRWIIQDGAQRFDRSWVQRLYAASELRALLLRTGYSQVRVYGSFEGQAYDQAARSLVMLAVK
jgi:SAM-dependent methyltransferase